MTVKIHFKEINIPAAENISNEGSIAAKISPPAEPKPISSFVQNPAFKFQPQLNSPLTITNRAYPKIEKSQTVYLLPFLHHLENSRFMQPIDK